MPAEGASVGVDIGGTFTDIVVLVERGADQRELEVAWTKVPSTPNAPAKAVLSALSKVSERSGLPMEAFTQFMHATTVGTNAVLERKGAKLAVLMTDGFEDTLEIGRQKRTQMYELALGPETPGFLCPGERRFGVPERISHDGTVLQELDVASLVKTTASLERLDVDAVAVCYLFSFKNGVHEDATRDLLAARLPGVAVSLSHEVSPVFREYERLCVTAFDAYLRPVIANYLGELRDRLSEAGFVGSMQTMKSRGGLASIKGAIKQPVTTMLSGPAAGVVGARFVAESAGVPNVITLDMGGTSADIAVVKEGMSLTSTQGGIGRYPLNIPMVDVQTIGAGGGSVAWLDAAGGLRVGPESAGSDPGPACYGMGGENPTVTDASLVLGYLDPEFFLGGGRTLDYDASWRAIQRLSDELNLSVPQTALGVHRIVNANMADAIRLASIKRGYDPRQFALMAFGGAGPVNAGALAAAMGMDCCIVPRAPGVLSALGLLASDVEYDNAQTFAEPLLDGILDSVAEELVELRAKGLGQMTADGYDELDCHVLYRADMRYVGQSTELEIPLDLPFDRGSVVECQARFEREHERIYGYAPERAQVEFVNLRAVVLRAPKVALSAVLGGDPSTEEDRDALEIFGYRECWFNGDEPRTTPIYRRGMSVFSLDIVGPAIIEQEDTTVVVYPDSRCWADRNGNLIMRRGEQT